MRLYHHSLTWTVMFGVIALMFLKLPPMAAKQDSVLNTYSALVEVDALARQQFVQPIADDRLVDGAIRGMILQLDPYSGYISAEEFPAFERRNRGQYFGVGVEVGVRDGHMVVIAPFEGSPASRAGVLAGDVIVAIDGKEMKHRSVFDAEEMLIGPPGSEVRIELRHPNESITRTLSIQRGKISLRSVHAIDRAAEERGDYWLDRRNGVGYIRVSNFREHTCEEFDKAMATLRGGSLRGLILDLRYNPGGFLHQAVAMADRFLSEGLIVSTVTRRNAVDDYFASEDKTDIHVPVVVLMNSASASAAEIVAGALQARDRAVVVGERSFGKGSVQHLIPLIGRKAAIKLTVAHYRLPDGRIIHRRPDSDDSDDWGIRPDVAVTLTSDEARMMQASRGMPDRPSLPTDPATSRPSVDCAGATATSMVDRQLTEAVRALNAAADSQRMNRRRDAVSR